MKKETLGLYFHVPFCDVKCPYCDFYSLPGDAQHSGDARMDVYTEALLKELTRYPGANRKVDTIYFGGGTPNLLGAARLGRILAAAGRAFSVAADAEITLEANPTFVDTAFFEALHRAGFNRISMGMQSANPQELRLLGRKHSPQDVTRAVQAAREGGFANISLDLMLALPGMTEESLLHSVRFATGLNVQHISAYILKIEAGTPFYAKRKSLALKADDETAALYFCAVQALKARGFAQYEISNFSVPGFESRHNLRYWRCEEYLGLGPSAHSFYRGKRFHNRPSLTAYLKEDAPVQDGDGGDFTEFVMLGLRLTAGITRAEARRRFSNGGAEFDRLLARTALIPPEDVSVSRDKIALTETGFAVSNSILAQLL